MSSPCSELKEEIKIRAALQQELRTKAQAEVGPARHELHLVRRKGRPDIRVLYLAYALLRGRPYTTVESNAQCCPSLSVLASTVSAYGAPLTEEQVRSWVYAPTSEAAAA